MRLRPAVALAVVMASVLWALAIAGPVFAVDSGSSESGGHGVIAAQSSLTAVVTEAAPAPSAHAAQRLGVDTGRAAHPKTAPEGSPLGVQLATIAVLLALGIGYFKAMTRTGRRTPPRKTE